MSVTVVSNTRNQSFANYDRSKFLLGGNEFSRADYTDSGSGTTLDAYLVVSKISATGKLVPWVIAGANGSQFPVGLLWLGGSEDIDVAASATKSLEYVNKGRIAKDLIAFPNAETLASVVLGNGRLDDWLEGLGLILEDTLNLTEFDNS